MPEIPSYQSRLPGPGASGLQPSPPGFAGGDPIQQGFNNLASGLLVMAHAQAQQDQLNQVEAAGDLLDKAEHEWLNTRDLILTHPDYASIQTKPLGQYELLKQRAVDISSLTVEKAREIGPAAAKYVTANLHSRFTTHLEAFGKEAIARQRGQNAVDLFSGNLNDTSAGRQAELGSTKHLDTIIARSSAYLAAGVIKFEEFKQEVNIAKNDIQLGQASTWVGQHSQEWIAIRQGKLDQQPADIQKAYQSIASMPGVDLDSLTEKARSTENFIHEGRVHKEQDMANIVKGHQDTAENVITDAVLASTSKKPFVHSDLINHPLYGNLSPESKRTLAHQVHILEHATATHNNLKVYGPLRDKLNSPYAEIINQVSDDRLERAAVEGHITRESGTELINLRNTNLRLLNNTKLSTFVKEAQDAHQLLTQFFRPLQGTIETPQQRAAWDSAMTRFNGIFWQQMSEADLKQQTPDKLNNYISPLTLAQEIFKTYGNSVSRMRTEQLKSTLESIGTPQTPSELDRRLMLEDALIQQQQLDIEMGINEKGTTTSPSGTRLGPKPTQ